MRNERAEPIKLKKQERFFSQDKFFKEEFQQHHKHYDVESQGHIYLQDREWTLANFRIKELALSL